MLTLGAKYMMGERTLLDDFTYRYRRPFFFTFLFVCLCSWVCTFTYVLVCLHACEYMCFCIHICVCVGDTSLSSDHFFLLHFPLLCLICSPSILLSTVAVSDSVIASESLGQTVWARVRS